MSAGALTLNHRGELKGLPPRFHGKPSPYRMRRLQCLRYAVERLDCSSGDWLAVYIDDFPNRAFSEMTSLAAICDGYIVCPYCEVILPAPRLRDGAVLCDECHANPPLLPMPFKLAVFFAATAATILCLIAAIYGITHLGGVR